jgi:hypothetical protein
MSTGTLDYKLGVLAFVWASTNNGQTFKRPSILLIGPAFIVLHKLFPFLWFAGDAPWLYYHGDIPYRVF